MKNLYNIKYIIFGFLSMLFVFSCTNLQVDEKDSIVIESSGGFQSGDPTELLNSAYTDLSAFCDQANIYSLYDHTSDEMIPPTRGTDWGDNGVWRTLHAHTWDPTHSYILGSWNQLNQRAFKCNQILASNPSTQEAAEAKFLRAFYMWHVMDLFGQVPFRAVTDGVDVDPKVYSRSEAFDFIVNDLTEALPDLPNTGPDPKNSRATQAAAHAMLARLYLNRAVYTATDNGESGYNFTTDDMNKVIEHCDAVTDAGYALETQYFVNFSVNASKEIIFTTASGSPENRWFMTLHYDQNPSGWNGFTTLADFYSKFEDSDQRKGSYPTPDGTLYSGIARGFLLGQQYKDDGSEVINSRNQQPLAFTPDVPLAGANTSQGIRVIKYHPSDAGQYIFLRYADVYLMKAEAIMRGGDGGGTTALEMVNNLRTIRGASTLTSMDESTMLDERGRELYWEGYRRVDQVRFGTFDDQWSEKENTDSYRNLFPIPQQALDSNPNLMQNPGY